MHYRSDEDLAHRIQELKDQIGEARENLQRCEMQQRLRESVAVGCKRDDVECQYVLSIVVPFDVLVEGDRPYDVLRRAAHDGLKKLGELINAMDGRGELAAGVRK